jgi:ubiquinone/menaquinone biosynthesis C-methylase UbiE
MNKSNTQSRPAVLVPGFVGAALLAAAWSIYETRPRQRQPGHEALDDPAVSAAFNRIAAWPQMRLLRRLVLRRATALVERGDALDLGCGPGHLVVELAQRAPGLHVTGLDLAADLLTQAEARAAAHGLSARTTFRRSDAAAIPCPPASFDLVVSTLSLHHWSDPVAVFDEVGRVLRPGGAFLLFDLRRDMRPSAYLLLWFATHVVVPAALRRVDEPLASRHAAYTPAEVAALAARSALRSGQVETGPLWLFLSGRVPAPAR